VKIKKIFIDHQVIDLAETKSIQSHLGAPSEIVKHAREVYDYVLQASDAVQRGKEVLYLTRNNGAFLKDCPGTRFYTCCGYKILHIGTFCNMDCSYCILQSYFHPPVLQYFVNHGELFSELADMFARKQIARIGTGEFTDSLIWECWTDFSTRLVPAFSRQDHCVLELKTKTASVERLKALPHHRKTIAAWSLNANRIIRTEERHTASLRARLKAAATCASWGYPLAFHFDPLVIYEGCEKDYEACIQQLFACIDPAHIVWISLGSLRFMPALKEIIQRRFTDSRIVYGEFISGLDGKMRYFKPLRIDLYRKMVSWIKDIAPKVLIYLCMEDDEVWEASFGFRPSEYGGLPKMLDKRAVQCCNLNPV
jgi:spore photoproduct lyase